MEKETIILDSLRRDTDAALRRAIRTVQENVTRLHEFAEWECPKDLRLVTYDNFKEQVAPRIEAVKTDLSLTEKERQDRLQKWHVLSMQFARFCKPVEEAVAEFPELEWSFFEANQNFIPKSNLDELVERRCTRELPPMAKTHFRLIQQARAAVEVLRDWEENHDVKCMPLAALVNLSLDSLAEGYINNSIIIDKRFGSPLNSTTQKRLII